MLLKVRFAEVNKSAIKEFRSQLATLQPPGDLTGDWQRVGQYHHDRHLCGRVVLALFNATASIEVLIRAPHIQGDVQEPGRAEPHYAAGKEASFLAGGEFPFPTVQGGAETMPSPSFSRSSGSLRFTPTITRGGASG